MVRASEQYRAALLAMPTGNEVECRDQALLALLLLTAMRDAAVVGLKLKHISLERRYVFQDPREIKTKFRKPIETTFLPVGEDITAIVRDWVTGRMLAPASNAGIPQLSVNEPDQPSWPIIHRSP